MFLYVFLKKIILINKYKLIIVFLTFICLPICVSIIIFFSRDINTNISVLPTMPYVIIFFLINIYKYVDENNDNVNILLRNIKYLSLILCVIIAYKWYVLNNVCYLTQQLQFDKTYAMAVRVLDRIETFDTYTKESKVLVIGNLPNENFPQTLSSNIRFIHNIEGINLEYSLYDGKTFFYFWYSFLGTIVNMETDIHKIDSIKNSDEFKNMNSYPTKDSIKEINGVIVVKL